MFSLMTYNIHKGTSAVGGRNTLEGIRAAIEQRDVDILFLQELVGESEPRTRRLASGVWRWPLRERLLGNQLEYMADSLWPHHAYGKNAIYASGHHGNAILSKHGFAVWENINVSRSRFASRSLLHATVVVERDNPPIHLVCVHLGLREINRRRQLGQLCDRIGSHVPPDEPLIVAGDFNDWRSSAAHHLEAALGLREVFKESQGAYARTFPVGMPMLAMDRIYFRGLHLNGGERLSGTPWRALSDHTPLLARFSELEQVTKAA